MLQSRRTDLSVPSVKSVVPLLLSCSLLVADAFAASFRFSETSIEELQRKMTAGELTSHALTQAYLGRIAEIDRAGPKLNSVLELNPEALAIADARDAERRAGKIRGPLHGIPVLIKDNIATRD